MSDWMLYSMENLVRISQFYCFFLPPSSQMTNQFTHAVSRLMLQGHNRISCTFSIQHYRLLFERCWGDRTLSSSSSSSSMISLNLLSLLSALCLLHSRLRRYVYN